MAGLCGVFHSGELVLFSSCCYIAAVLLRSECSRIWLFDWRLLGFFFFFFPFLNSVLWNEITMKNRWKVEIPVAQFSVFLSLRLNCAAEKRSYSFAGLNQSKAINHKSERMQWGDSALIKFTFVCLINLVIQGLIVQFSELFLWVWIWRIATDKRWHHIYSACHILNQ